MPQVPAAMGDLIELKQLLLYKNSIGSLPEELSKCTKLEVLNLFNNKASWLLVAVSTGAS